jgi:hypothetical protein
MERPIRPETMLLRLVFKHTVATAVIVAATVVLAVVSYFGLLIWAIAADSGIGGPLALPFMMLAGLLAALGACALVFLPTTLAAEIVRRRAELQFFWEIPLAAVGSAVLCLVIVWLVRSTHAIDAHLIRDGALVWATLAVPLGAYWWSAPATDLVWFAGLRVGRWAIQQLRAKPPKIAAVISQRRASSSA